MSAEVRQSPWPRLAAGLVILTVGVLFWLDRIDRIDARDYLEWWPLALIAFGLGHLAARRWAGVAEIALGVIFLMPLAGYPRPDLWQVVAAWPLLISAAGATLVVQTFGARDRLRAGAAEFRAVAVMAGNVRRIVAPTTGGEAFAVMGGCEVEVAPTAIHGDEMVIDVLALWGGIEIRVPRGWNVVNQVIPILGGVDDKRVRGGDPGAPRLIVRGSVIMAGVEVKNSTESLVA